MTPRDTLIALTIIVVWGVNFMAIKWGVAEVPPLLLTALRYVVAAVPAIFFVKRPKVGLGILIAYGLAIGVGQFGLLFSAIQFAVSMAEIITGLAESARACTPVICAATDGRTGRTPVTG